jgi:acyl-coenzyme A synthetase/AMP-(fatty) acid ligase
VVAVQSAGFEGWMICCAYVPVRGRSLDPQFLRHRLARVLPGYMLPAHWMRCDALPRNANGKTDRPVLRRRFLEAKRAALADGARVSAVPGSH